MSKSSILIFALLGFIAGAYLGISIFHRPVSQYADFYQQKIVLQGKIVSDVEIHKHQARFDVLPDGFSQKILVTALNSQYFSYGDYVYIAGKLRQPKSLPDFDYINHLAAKNIYAQVYYPEIFILSPARASSANPIIYYGLKFKRKLFDALFKNFADRREQAGLLIALLTGQKNFLSDFSVQAFNSTGTAHMIAVSGYKLTLIMISLESFAAFIGRKKVLLLSLLFSAIYIIVADFAPAVMRAAVMSGLFIFARSSGKKYNLLPALIFTAAILVFFNPLILRYDLGFILSFSGILGIIYFGPIVASFLTKIPADFGIKEIFISTTAAQLATTPIIIYYFHQLPIIALISNLLIVPLLAPSIMFGYFCALPFAGKIFAEAMIFPLNYILAITHNFYQFKYSFVPLTISPAVIVGIYLGEIIALFFF